MVIMNYVTNSEGERFYVGDEVTFKSMLHGIMIIMDIDSENCWGEEIGNCHWLSDNLRLVRRPVEIVTTPDWGL